MYVALERHHAEGLELCAEILDPLRRVAEGLPLKVRELHHVPPQLSEEVVLEVGGAQIPVLVLASACVRVCVRGESGDAVRGQGGTEEDDRTCALAHARTQPLTPLSLPLSPSPHTHSPRPKVTRPINLHRNARFIVQDGDVDGELRILPFVRVLHTERREGGGDVRVHR